MQAYRSFLGSVLLTAVPFLAAAQRLSPEIVGQINASSTARVRLVAGRDGTLYGTRADSASLTYRQSAFLDRGGRRLGFQAPLAIGQVAEIQVRTGSYAVQGAKAGAGVGAALTLLAILVCRDRACEMGPGQGLVAFAASAAIGAGVGAALGSSTPRWATVYRDR